MHYGPQGSAKILQASGLLGGAAKGRETILRHVWFIDTCNQSSDEWEFTETIALGKY